MSSRSRCCATRLSKAGMNSLMSQCPRQLRKLFLASLSVLAIHQGVIWSSRRRLTNGVGRAQCAVWRAGDAHGLRGRRFTQRLAQGAAHADVHVRGPVVEHVAPLVLLAALHDRQRPAALDGGLSQALPPSTAHSCVRSAWSRRASRSFSKDRTIAWPRGSPRASPAHACCPRHRCLGPRG